MKFSKFLSIFTLVAATSVYADGVISLTERIQSLDAEVTQTSTEDNGWVSATVTETDGKLTAVSVTVDGSKYETAGSVASAVTAATNALDSTVSHTAGADGLAVSVTQTDGKLTAITASIAEGTYDAAGAAATAKSEVIGTNVDDGSADTIYGAKAYADSVAAAQDITIAEGTTDGTISVTKGEAAAVDVPVHGLGSAAYTASTDYDAAGTAAAAVAALDTASDVTTASVSGGVVTLTAGVKEVDGLIAKGSGTDITLAKVATTGAAEDVSYDNTDTGLDATTVQAAIDEIITEKASDIDARIILAITNGITVNGVTYKLVVDPAGN